MNLFKVIIAGGRDLVDWQSLEEFCDKVLSSKLQEGYAVQVVSGRCSTGIITFDAPDGMSVCGADGLGEWYADKNGYDVKHFPADWKRYGKSAGIIRNGQMAEYADALIAFWDGKSTVTANMIERMRNKSLPVRVFKY